MLPGREAVSGESLRLDNASNKANDAIETRWMSDYVPPALTIDSVLDAHALATVRA